jgi:hypothetical protein
MALTASVLMDIQEIHMWNVQEVSYNSYVNV